jgi:hypothetical protein
VSQHQASRILQHILAVFLSALLCEPRRWIPLDSEKGIEVSVLPRCRLDTYCRLSCFVTGSSDATSCDQSQELDQYAAEPEVHKYLHSR